MVPLTFADMVGMIVPKHLKTIARQMIRQRNVFLLRLTIPRGDDCYRRVRQRLFKPIMIGGNTLPELIVKFQVRADDLQRSRLRLIRAH